MNKILFIFYYIKLLFSVILGVHKTLHPLNIKWRWEHWRRMRKYRGVTWL